MLGRLLRALHVDGVLLAALVLVAGVGLVALYSASGENMAMVLRQATRLAIAFGALLVVAQIPPRVLYRAAPWLFWLGILLLGAVLAAGDVGKGAQRWLDLGIIRFQPSEIMKLAMPMMVAWLAFSRPLPVDLGRVAICGALIALTAVLIAAQPDLGTALLVAAAGFFALFLAGLRWRIMIGLAVLGTALTPVLWHFMHGYQRQRVLMFLNPEQDPLGAGYHIIQSKIAIGSGGLFGKGWLNGTQSQLEFLPERSTDFIFAVFAEEFGLLGLLALLATYLFIIGRGLWIAANAQDTFGRLLGGSLALTFFVYVFVNAGMVSGLLPVVGVPLPLFSYGGTAMVTLLAGFGILMSIHTHRKLISY
ncbi:MAG: rod shape-determining protein RodA [Xanthomonadaceae bacterium]|nr:rod shape-determining protein RodA [Xanthomonadaceae bacterium]